jgi:hypothetical protein
MPNLIDLFCENAKPSGGVIDLLFNLMTKEVKGDPFSFTATSNRQKLFDIDCPSGKIDEETVIKFKRKIQFRDSVSVNRTGFFRVSPEVTTQIAPKKAELKNM